MVTKIFAFYHKILESAWRATVRLANATHSSFEFVRLIVLCHRHLFALSNCDETPTGNVNVLGFFENVCALCSGEPRVPLNMFRLRT